MKLLDIMYISSFFKEIGLVKRYIIFFFAIQGRCTLCNAEIETSSEYLIPNLGTC